jgi:hypothetical protein
MITTVRYIYTAVIPAIYTFLPAKMDTPESRVQLIATGLQETKFIHRVQMGGGPAHSFWQFERGGGVAGVLNHRATRQLAGEMLEMMRYPVNSRTVHGAMADNDILACAMARLLLWTDPKPIPGPNEPEAAWNYYMGLWRPSKPHREPWDGYYEQAWALEV